MSHQKKEFSISSWAVDNRITVYILTFIIIVMGTMAYINMPRENFPEILENKIYVSSVFPGNSSEDLEKLVSDFPNLLVLSDEVYEFIHFEDNHISANSSEILRERAIIVSSFGKTFHITGWKIGYVVAPKRIMLEIKCSKISF